jgi:hypothetical protein
MKKYTPTVLIICLLTGIPAAARTLDLTQVPESDWVQLFNGVDLTDWVPSVAGYETG